MDCLVRIYWSGIDEESRLAISSSIPKFLEEYLTNDIQNEFDRALIDQLTLPEIVKRKIIDNLVEAYPITAQHPMISNIRRFLIASGLLEHAPTRSLMKQYL
ncbi:P-aminobenzoate N-oxygenase AurF [Serratia sp. DD3]|nr:P-aminobenzoate N-oxygenase AurF [Serratia sp. DD3]